MSSKIKFFVKHQIVPQILSSKMKNFPEFHHLFAMRRHLDILDRFSRGAIFSFSE